MNIEPSNEQRFEVSARDLRVQIAQGRSFWIGALLGFLSAMVVFEFGLTGGRLLTLS